MNTTEIETVKAAKSTKFKVAKRSFCIENLQGVVNSLQSKGGSLRRAAQELALGKNVLEFDGNSQLILGREVIGKLLTAKKITKAEASKLRALHDLAKALDELSKWINSRDGLYCPSLALNKEGLKTSEFSD